MPLAQALRLHRACPCGYQRLPDRSPRTAHENTTFVRNPRPLSSPRWEQNLEGCLKIVLGSSQGGPKTPITACSIENTGRWHAPCTTHARPLAGQETGGGDPGTFAAPRGTPRSGLQKSIMSLLDRQEPCACNTTPRERRTRNSTPFTLKAEVVIVTAL